MVTIDNRLIKRWYIGCTPDEPYETWELSDLRSSPIVYVQVPVDKGPTMAMVIYEGDAGCSFGASTIGITVATTNSSLGRMDYVRGDGLKRATYNEGSWGSRSANLPVRLYPLYNYLAVQNPISADPGYAPTGRGKVWYWREK